MGVVVINGKVIKTPNGSSVSVVNNCVFVDGKPWDDENGNAEGIVKIEVTGDLTSLRSDCDVVVNGNIMGDVKAIGSLEAKDIAGSVDTGGSVRCGDIDGNVNAGGSVRCGNIGGRIDAGGSVSMSSKGTSND